MSDSRIHPDRMAQRDTRSQSTDRKDKDVEMRDASGKDEPVKLLEKNFNTRDDLIGFFRAILHQHEPGYVFNAEEFAMAEALLKRRDDWKKKCGEQKMKGCSVGYSMRYTDTKCFNLLRADNTKDDWSYLKIANKLFPNAARNAKNEHKTKFLPGLIVRIDGVPPADDEKVAKEAAEEIKAYFKEHFRMQVEYADIQEHQTKAYVRFDNPKSASTMIVKLGEMRPPPKMAGCSIKCEVLKGKEESDYWDDLRVRLNRKKEDKARKAAMRGGRGGRGRGRGGPRGRGGFRGGRGGPPRDFAGDFARGGDGFGGGGAGVKRSSYEGRDRDGGRDDGPKRYRSDDRR